MGRYSNHPEQGERLRALVEMVPSDPIQPIVRPKKQVQRRLRSAEIEELVRDYHAGGTVYELAEKFVIHRNTVSGLLDRRGVPRRGQPLTTTQIDRAALLYESGQSLARIGSQLKSDPNTVRRALLGVGVRMRDSHGRER